MSISSEPRLRVAFKERWGGCSLEEDILETQAVFTFSESLGVDPRSWEFDLKHYAEEPDLFGSPVFRGEQCRAPFSFRYGHLNHNLLVTGMIYVDDDQSAMIGTLTCSPSQQKLLTRTRLLLAGINTDTLEAVGHNVEMSRKVFYLDYVKALAPQQRRDAIFDLAQRTWGTGNPKFLDHPKLASELERLGISELAEADLACQVGPVEFDGRRCTVPLTYYLYGEGELSTCFGYYVEVHILARIGNKPSRGDDISIENMWFSDRLVR